MLAQTTRQLDLSSRYLQQSQQNNKALDDRNHYL